MQPTYIKVYITNTYYCYSVLTTPQFHGSGDTAINGINCLPAAFMEEKNVYVLCMASQKYTWDMIVEKQFAKDTQITDLALSQLMTHFPHIQEISIAGFSDGASYALSLGAANKDIFRHIFAFSPGYIRFAPSPSGSTSSYSTAVTNATDSSEKRQYPRVFISHGKNDRVLPVTCSHRIVDTLEMKGFDGYYKEFDGGHTVPPEVAIFGLSFWMQ